MREVTRTLKKLKLFFRHSSCSVKVKYQVYNAIVRAKLMYGLESVHLNASTLNKLDAFQLRGFRQMLKWDTTYGQMVNGVTRSNTNDKVFAEIEN